MTGTYILINKEPVEERNLELWGRWMGSNIRTIKKDVGNVRVDGKDVGQVKVSTVFLGLDHQYGDGPPLLFETMVFGGPLDGEMIRCSSYEAAEEMHKTMLERVKIATSKMKV